jgi:biopolymer transport protein TolR
MGMAVGGKRDGPKSDPNVVPMIDVLLVLLVIFMVVQQGLQRGLSVQVPPPAEEQDVAQREQDDQAIVLEIEAGPEYFINRQPVLQSNLEAELREVFAPRPRKVIFIRGAEDVQYGAVINAVDISRAAGVEVVGLVPRAEVGQATQVAAP